MKKLVIELAKYLNLRPRGFVQVEKGTQEHYTLSGVVTLKAYYSDEGYIHGGMGADGYFYWWY